MRIKDVEEMYITNLRGDKRWKVKNYTGEAIHIYQGDQVFEFLPSGRATLTSSILSYDAGGIILEETYIKSTPEPEEGTLFLVPYKIAMESKRPDFIYISQFVECPTRYGKCAARLGIIKDATKEVNHAS